MKRLFAFIFKVPLVYTEDYNGAVRLRLVRKFAFGKYFVFGIVSSRVGILTYGGKMQQGTYMSFWKPANKYGEEIAFLFKLEES